MFEWNTHFWIEFADVENAHSYRFDFSYDGNVSSYYVLASYDATEAGESLSDLQWHVIGAAPDWYGTPGFSEITKNQYSTMSKRYQIAFTKDENDVIPEIAEFLGYSGSGSLKIYVRACPTATGTSGNGFTMSEPRLAQMMLVAEKSLTWTTEDLIEP